MTVRTLPPTPTGWQQVTPEGCVDIEQVRVGVHAVEDQPNVAVIITELPRTYTVVERWCPHRQMDLTIEGQVNSTTGLLGCVHRRESWCVMTGRSLGKADDVTVYPSHLYGGRLYAALPDGTAA